MYDKNVYDKKSRLEKVSLLNFPTRVKEFVHSDYGFGCGMNKDACNKLQRSRFFVSNILETTTARP